MARPVLSAAAASPCSGTPAGMVTYPPRPPHAPWQSVPAQHRSSRGEISPHARPAPPMPQREAIGSRSRSHLLLGSGEVPADPSAPHRTPAPSSPRNTQLGALRWLCGLHAPSAGSSCVRFELRSLWKPFTSRPGRRCGAAPFAPACCLGHGVRPTAAQHEAAPNAALRPQPLSPRLSSPLSPLRTPPPCPCLHPAEPGQEQPLGTARCR